MKHETKRKKHLNMLLVTTTIQRDAKNLVNLPPHPHSQQCWSTKVQKHCGLCLKQFGPSHCVSLSIRVPEIISKKISIPYLILHDYKLTGKKNIANSSISTCNRVTNFMGQGSNYLQCNYIHHRQLTKHIRIITSNDWFPLM